MDNFTCIQEIVLAARRRLDKNVWDFVVGGAESETTVKRNRAAWDSLAFQPEPFNDVEDIDTKTTLLSRQMRLPVILAPMGSVNSIDPAGSLAQVKAANKFNCIAFISGVAQPATPEVASKAVNGLVHTVYVAGDRAWLRDELDEVLQTNIDAIAMLADTAYFGRRERDLLNHYHSKVPNTHTRSELKSNRYSSRITWQDIEWVKQYSGLPLVIKGIHTSKAARMALEHGADIIYVSNHGGRQLDHLPGCADVLPDIVETVNDVAPIIVDGGIWRGSDLVKAIGLGATAVGIGRLQALALAAGGADGLVRALEILEYETLVTMGLLGVDSIDKIEPNHLRKGSSVTSPDVFSTLPQIKAIFNE